MKKTSLPDLIAKVKQQDEEAFNELYRRYHKLVRYIAYGLTKNHADTDEIVQEVFIQVQKSIQDLKDPEQFKAWISRITYSKAKMLFRKSKDHYMDDETLDVLQNVEEIREDFCPQKKARHQSDLNVLNACLNKLKPQYREVLVLHFFSQLSIKEIAEITENPEGTIKSRLLYAKKYLRIEIEAYEKESGEALNFYGKALEAALFSLGHSLVKEPRLYKIPFLKITVPTSTLLMAAQISLSAILSFGVVYGIKDWMDHNSYISDDTEAIKKEFPFVEYQNHTITTPREAYTVLIHFADCDVEMRSKSKEELQAILPVYEALMNYDGGYYELLERRSWDQLFAKYK